MSSIAGFWSSLPSRLVCDKHRLYRPPGREQHLAVGEAIRHPDADSVLYELFAAETAVVAYGASLERRQFPSPTVVRSSTVA